jgi:subtilisin family serine protease
MRVQVLGWGNRRRVALGCLFLLGSVAVFLACTAMTRAWGRPGHEEYMPAPESWTVLSPQVEIHSYTLDDVGTAAGDGLADPGETLALTVTLVNVGQGTALDVQATLSMTHPYVTLTQAGAIAYGDLVSAQPQAPAQPFGVRIDGDMPPRQTVTFTLTVHAAQGGPWLDQLRLPVGWQRTFLPLVARQDVSDRIPNDVYYPLLWALPLIDAPDAWRLTYGAASIVVAVADTGIDLEHPDLVDKLWVNVDEIPGNGLDDDANGWVDDVHGYDFWYNDADPDDDNGHGTHVAGIIAAATDNEIGVAALGWRSSLMPLKTQASNGIGTTAELAEAIVYAVDNGAHVVNLSVGQELSQCPNTLQAAIDYADRHGVLVVAATGNRDLDPDKAFYPAACERVLGVTVTDEWDRCVGANRGDYVDVAAPGRNILSTLPGGAYGYASGSSMATPLVSGLAALLYAHYPAYDNEQVAWAILAHAVDLGVAGRDPDCGWGRIHAYRSVAFGATDARDYAHGAEGQASEVNAWAPGELLLKTSTSTCVSALEGARPSVPALNLWRVAVPRGQERVYREAWRDDPCFAWVELNYFTGLAP